MWALRIEVVVAGWVIDDGHPEIKVGVAWAPTIELQRLGPSTASDWHPLAGPAQPGARMMLRRLGVAPGAFEFVATPVLVGEGWTVLEACGARFAAPGRHVGAVAGRGLFNHDTYFINEDDPFMSFLAQPITVDRVQWRPSTSWSEGTSDARAGSSGLETVGSTHAQRWRRSVGAYVISGSVAESR